jgi:hypothetical protein
MFAEDNTSVIYFHRGCNDGQLAAALLARFLHETTSSRIELRSLAPSMTPWFEQACVARRAYFIDLFPNKALVEILECKYEHIVAINHYATFADLAARLRDSPKWTVHHDTSACAAALVARLFPLPDVARWALALEMVDKYDRRLEPTDDVFAWMFASQLIWNGLGLEKTDLARCLRYTDALADATLETMRALGAPVFGPLKTMYRLQRPFTLRLADPTSEWDGMAIAMVRNNLLNPSIACHWMLQANPQAEVAPLISVENRGSGPLYVASVRSHTLDTTKHVPSAKGYPCASGCVLTQAQMDSAEVINE